MAKNYKTEIFDKEHRHFGGLIYESDFNTDYRCNDNRKGSIAQRIAYDLKLESDACEIIQKIIGGK